MTDVYMTRKAWAMGDQKVKRPNTVSTRHQSVTTKERILEAAISLFAQRGFEGASMRQIAKISGITPAALYNHYQSKEEMLIEVQAKFIEDLINKVEALPEGLSSVKRIELVCEYLMEAIFNNTQPYKILVYESHHFAAREQRELRARAEKFETLVKNIIEEGVHKGEFKKPSRLKTATFITMALNFLLGAFNYAVRWVDPQRELSAKAIAKLFASLFLEGIANKC